MIRDYDRGYDCLSARKVSFLRRNRFILTLDPRRICIFPRSISRSVRWRGETCGIAQFAILLYHRLLFGRETCFFSASPKLCAKVGWSIWSGIRLRRAQRCHIIIIYICHLFFRVSFVHTANRKILQKIC